MNKSIKWLEEEEAEEVEEILLSPVEECLDFDAFGVSIIAGMTESGKTNLVKQIMRYNSQNYHKIYLVCSTINLQSEYDYLSKQAVLPLSEESIEEVLEKQKRKNKQGVALIFDDVLGKMHFQNTNLFDSMASSCCNFRLHAFLLVQDLCQSALPMTALSRNGPTLFCWSLSGPSL